MKRTWIALGIGTVIGGLLAPSLTSPVVGIAPVKPTPVEVVNFPDSQNVAGSVAVTNLPAVQNVAGQVAVGNLPLDASGNLKVAEQAGQGNCSPTLELELRFHESDRVPGSDYPRLPRIPMPPCYSHVEVSVATSDPINAGYNINYAEVRFGSEDSPVPFPRSYSESEFLTPLRQGSRHGFEIGGSRMEIEFGNYPPSPPPDIEYYVHLYFTK